MRGGRSPVGRAQHLIVDAPAWCDLARDDEVNEEICLEMHRPRSLAVNRRAVVVLPALGGPVKISTGSTTVPILGPQAQEPRTARQAIAHRNV